MKKKSPLVLVLIVLIPVVLIGLFILEKDGSMLSSKRKILVEKSYTNYAWGERYRGMAICDDGTIYKWDMPEEYFDEMVIFDTKTSLKYESDMILKYATKNNKSVSSKELEILKTNISNLSSYMSKNYGGNDMGSNIISVWNYDNGSRVVIKESGDFRGENTSEEAQRIIKIVNKYLY